MDFDQIAEQQGWDESTMLMICRDYIATTDGNSEMLSEFAQQIADQENGE